MRDEPAHVRLAAQRVQSAEAEEEMSRFVGASAARALLVFFIVCLGTGAVRAQDTCDAGGVLCSSVVVIDPFGGQKLEQTFCCPGEVCIESKCWASPPRCNVDADCGPDGGICGSGKICKCTNNAQCGPNLICQDEHCVLTCDDNGDCGEGL